MTRALEVRARVAARPEPRFERLYDPILDDLARGGSVSRARFRTHWTDTAALARLADAKRGPLPPELTRALVEQHRRLGASPASLANLDRLARGDAVAAVAGQQPGPLGGPLYSLHKIASTVGLAEAFAARTAAACVPVFWMHGEDSDFAEIRSTTLADPALTLHDLALPDRAHRDGALVGNVALAPLEALERDARPHWAGLAGSTEAGELLAAARGRARDIGEAYSALMLALFAEQGLIVIDPRLPEFRMAARRVIDRYLARAGDLSAAARHAGETLASVGRRVPLADASLDSFVFAIEDGVRRKLTAAEARATSLPLSASVALRPAVQDGVLPTVVMACGPGEAAYLAQLTEVFAGLDVEAACPVPRFGATWLPPAALELLKESGADAWDLVAGADTVLRQLAERRIPEEARATLAAAQRTTLESLERFSAAAQRVDPSLPQMVESARGKVDYQFQRLAEGLASKVRHQLDRRHPEWLRLRYYLMPGEKLQERRLCSLEPVAYRGAAVAGELARLAREQADALERGTLEHFVLEL